MDAKEYALDARDYLRVAAKFFEDDLSIPRLLDVGEGLTASHSHAVRVLGLEIMREAFKRMAKFAVRRRREISKLIDQY